MTNTLNLITNPVKIYKDCEEGKKDIFLNYRNVTAIYMWYNNINGKKYIGSASKLYNRICDYFQKSRIFNSNRLIDKGIVKYSLKNFSLIILEIINNDSQMDKLKFRDFYVAREQYFMDLYKPEYNICLTAGSGFGYLFSEERKNNMRGSLNPFFGKTHTPEARKKISDSRKGVLHPLYGKPKSIEFIAQQQKDQTGSKNHMSKKVYVYNYINNEYIFIKEFETITSTAKYLELNRKTIHKYCNNCTIFYNLKDKTFYYFSHKPIFKKGLFLLLLAGCPRRVSDYPDGYAGWNYISSIGSMISLIASLLFVYIVYRQFADRILATNLDNNKLFSEFFNNRNKIIKINSEKFEFNVSIPPKFHTFNELPVTY